MPAHTGLMSGIHTRKLNGEIGCANLRLAPLPPSLVNRKIPLMLDYHRCLAASKISTSDLVATIVKRTPMLGFLMRDRWRRAFYRGEFVMP